jgi:hypothetical protein
MQHHGLLLCSTASFILMENDERTVSNRRGPLLQRLPRIP